MKSNEVLPKWDHPHQYFWPTPGEDSTNQTKHDNLPSLFKNGESGENSMCRSPFVTKLLQWTVESLNIKDSQPLRTKNTDFSPSSYWNSENFQFTSLENHFSRIRIYVEISSGYTLLLILGMLENVSSKTINSLWKILGCKMVVQIPICKIRPRRKWKSFKQEMTPIKLKKSPWLAHMFIHFRALGVLPSLGNWLFRLDPWAFST